MAQTEIALKISDLPQMQGLIDAALLVVQSRHAPEFDIAVRKLEVSLRQLSTISSGDLRRKIERVVDPHGGADEVSDVVP